MRSLAANTVLECRIEPTELLGEPVRLAEWDFAHVKQTKRSETIETRITRPGVLHGVAIWLVEWLTNQIALSAALPTTLSARLWPNFFLPIHSPVRVEAGETVHIRVQTGFREWPKLWCWDVAVRDGKNEERGRYVQSTLSSCFLGKDALRKQAPDYVPNLSGQAVALRFILEACDGVRSLRSIEQEVAQRFPNLFPNQRKAAEFVAKVVHGNCV
jgi:hypothetical protein